MPTRLAPVLLVVLLAVPPSAAQGVEPSTESLDARLLHAVYAVDHPVFAGVMRAANATALPAVVVAPPAAWAGVALFRNDGDWRDAWRVTVAEGTAIAGMYVLKQVVRRPRPFVDHPGIDSRSGATDAALQAKYASYSFPSGHAMVAFALTTSWSLSHPEWYVVAPGMLWASSVALSRVWMGVHYPSDVAAGALLGAAIGTGVHLLGPSITPAFLEPDDEPRPALHVRLRF